MFLRNFNVHAENNFYANAIAIHIYERLQNGDISLLSGLQFTTHHEGDFVEPKEAIQLPRETAQQLMDALWQCGLRPSEGTGSAGSLKATENHLKDMQDLSRRLLGIFEQRLLAAWTIKAGYLTPEEDAAIKADNSPSRK
jgi:hypothetical protein